MIDRQELQYVYNLTESYAQTALYFGISRQRIHQLITGYRTIYNRMNKSLQRELMLRGTTCEKCKQSKFKNIHHLDGNSNNNAPTNLIKVCKPCHNTLHTGIEHKSKYRGNKCQGLCGRIIGIDIKSIQRVCDTCRSAIRDGRTKVLANRMDDPNRKCGICEISLVNKSMKKGLCVEDYRRWRYFFDNKFRAHLNKNSGYAYLSIY